MFRLPIEYDPTYPYRPAELVALIRPHVPLLCFLASTSGEQRCVLGLQFDDYDPVRQTIAVLIIPPTIVRQVWLPLHGKQFQQAYRASRVGRSLIITYSAPQGAGWFAADWQMDETRVRRYGPPQPGW